MEAVLVVRMCSCNIKGSKVPNLLNSSVGMRTEKERRKKGRSRVEGKEKGRKANRGCSR